MGAVDPKDMTASELVRWVENYTDIMCRACREMGFGCDDAEVGDCEKALEFIADKIDAELAQASELSLLRGAELWAKANGWPDFREGEDFGAWLDRCFLPRPRFEDGEPVQISDMEEIGALATYRVYMDGSWEFEPDKYEDETSPKLWDVQFGAKSERVKRPAPEALGADGLPIKAGETVWGILSGIEGTVSSMNDDSTAYVKWDDGRWSPCIDCCNLTHTPPETQERIDDDVTLPPREYYNAHIGHDVGLKDDEEVAVAMVHDLLRRQRELDKRTGGE